MRFAWLQETEYSDRTFASSGPGRALLVAYNLIWWVPIVLPLTGAISYHAGFLAFFSITVIRAVVNAFRINVMPSEKAMVFPLRQP